MNHADRSAIEQRVVVAWQKAVQSLFQQEPFYKRTDQLTASELVTVYMILEAMIPINIAEPSLTREDLQRMRENALERAYQVYAVHTHSKISRTRAEKEVRANFLRLKNIAEALVMHVKKPGASSLEEFRSMLFFRADSETDAGRIAGNKVVTPKTDRSTTQPFAYDPGYLSTLREDEVQGSQSSSPPGKNMEHSTMRPASSFANPSTQYRQVVGSPKKPQR